VTGEPHSEDVAREIARLHRAGKTEDAFTLALEAAARFPTSPIAQTNLGYFYVIRGEPASAIRAYEAALRLNAQNPEARRGLAVAKQKSGTAAQGDSIAIVPHRGTGRAVRVLVPITLGTGNIVTERLFDDTTFETIKLAVELHADGAELPVHDVVFNAVGEADSSEGALERARALLASSDKRVLNAPHRIVTTGRIAQAQRLAGIPGVVTPRIALLARADARALAFPALLRSPGFHAGEHFVRVETQAQVDEALATLPGDPLFAIGYVDTRDAQGGFAKYRVMVVDGAIYPLHLAIGFDWKVHYFSAAMAANEAFRERERRFLTDPHAALGADAWSALERVAASIDLEYFGIDFALDAHGNVVVFEANATMAVRYPAEEALWAYRRPAVDAVLGAVRAMLLRYSPSI
jgi:tetratricopeptide (TPR) repeat protein